MAGGSRFVATDRLEVDDAVYVPWDEAVEHVVDVAPSPLTALTTTAREHSFRLPAGADIQTVRQHDEAAVGRVVRRRHAVDGCVRISAERGPEDFVKVTVTVSNTTDWSRDRAPRDEVVSHSLVAVHTMLAVDDGAFVSLLDPPERARVAAAGCVNDGTFPVLIGGGDVVLSSPIILYDQPQVAPESIGDLYDATEIDEILALPRADPDRRREGGGRVARILGRRRSSTAATTCRPSCGLDFTVRSDRCNLSTLPSRARPRPRPRPCPGGIRASTAPSIRRPTAW